MEHIIQYLKQYGNIPFAQKKFSEVDALVLAQFSYLKFDGLVPRLTDDRDGISLLRMKQEMDDSVVYADERYEKDNRALFEGMAAGKRFQTMVCNFYTDIIDEAVETQFSAITCFPDGALPVIVFRGTDENIVGWKEDFNMAFRKPVTGQKLSVLYMNQTGLRLTKSFLVCGHSKGGNFAVYSAMNVQKEIQNRIQKIYSFDGPGFRPEILSSDDYAKIESRVEKLIPHSSLVGMILENHENYKVVESSSVGVLQHNPYTWILEGDHFKWADDIYKGTKFMNHSMNEWILKLNDDELNTFVETFFSVIEGADVRTTIEVTMDWKKSMIGILNAMKNVDDDTKETIRHILLQFFEILAVQLKKNKAGNKKQKIRKKTGKTLNIIEKKDDK